MTTPTMPDGVVDNGDGTYTIRDDGDWCIEPHGRDGGWVAAQLFEDWHRNFRDVVFATAEDAARAILGDPAPCRLFDGRTYGEVYG